MSSNVADQDQAAGLPSIDALFQPTHDELARQSFVSALRKHAIVDMRELMRRDYETHVAPEFLQKNGRPPGTPREIEQVMSKNPFYRFYSSVRYNAQEMVWLSVQEPVERALPSMIEIANDAARRNPAGGSLRLDPALEIPRYVSAQDVHLVPGCFHSEFTTDDVAQGAVMAAGNKVFTGAIPHRRGNPGGVGQSMGYWLKCRFPDFRPRRILDIGTSSGKNLLPYLESFPDAEMHGVDVSAPLLRYGHARAEHLGVAVHFSQQNAEFLDYPDGYFDLVVSSFLFHEVPVPSTKRILAQCNRILAPGGIMAHMELPPHELFDPWTNFVWDWDTKFNNEPSYTSFRSQNPQRLVEGAGLADGFSITIPDLSTLGADEFARFIAGDRAAPRHGTGGWFLFGGHKPA